MVIGNLDLKRIQAGDEDAFRDVFRLFGCRIEDRPTFDEVKFYQFEDLLPTQELGELDDEFKERAYSIAEAIVESQLNEAGWETKIFGPDRDGNGFTVPRLGRENYNTKCIWVFQPYCTSSAGSLSPAYNLLWTVSHELAHAFTNERMTEKFGGQGKRRGALGVCTHGNTYSLSKAGMKPLSLVDALRATEWEHHATLVQRNVIRENYHLNVTDRDLLGEYQYNIAGSVIRTLCGFFCTPGELGVVPQPGNMTADEMNQLAQDIYRAAARKMGMGLREHYKRSDDSLSPELENMLDSASAHRDGHH